MLKVRLAEPFRSYAMCSTGDASGMLLRQSKFPYAYRKDEEIWSADHDRIASWDHNHWVATIAKHKEKLGEFGLESWFQNGKAEDILAFLIDMMKAEGKAKWTGFRILGTVNRSNGYPVYSLQLFAKNPKGKTTVYSSENAPNVKRPERIPFRFGRAPNYFVLHGFENDYKYQDYPSKPFVKMKKEGQK